MDDMEQIYQAHARTVYKFLLSQCHDAGLAEELTQETFYQAVRSIGRFQGDCKVSVWLCQIAKHLWYQHLRRFPGVGPLGNCRIFVFHDDYSRKRLLLQEGKPPRPIGPGRLISSHNPAPVRRC